MTSTVTLKTGDIILTNYISVFSKLAEIGGQRWGHVAICVVLKDDKGHSEPFVYEIALENGKPTVIPFSDMLKNPTLKEVGIRQLSKPLTTKEEKKFKDILIEYESARYPAVKKVISKLLSSTPKERSEDTGEYLCSELVYTILYSMGLVPEEKSVFGNLPILPDAFTAGTLPVLDGLYGPSVKIVYKNNIPPEAQKAILTPQLQHFVHHLV